MIGKDGQLAVATQSGVFILQDGIVQKQLAGKINYTPTSVAASASGNEIAVGAEVSSLPKIEILNFLMPDRTTISMYIRLLALA